MYLPQFHRIPENDVWWGEGFTEWTSVKGAKPLFDGHNMPKKPLNGYYNLLDKETMEWQSELMHQYGVDGMCFYHYYFKNGKKILEKPAENLLRWKDINMPYCFSWANETWARSWSNISSKNVWSLDQKCNNQGDNGILLEQSYGGEKEWTDHFNYLLPFFSDERYIKINGNPVFMIYKPEDIYCINSMVSLWQELAIKNNIPGIYLIANNSSNECFDACVHMEPQYTMGRDFAKDNNKKDGSRVASIIDYRDLIKKSISNQHMMENREKKAFLSIFPGYDDTPRRGTAGTAVTNSIPSMFEKYATDIFSISEKRGNDFVFVNAWNEWGESMYLEPDIPNNYAWLESIKNARSESTVKLEDKHESVNDTALVEQDGIVSRYRSYWKTFDNWMRLRDKDISISKYFEDRKINQVAIYGIGMFYYHLQAELIKSGIKILFGVDKKGDSIEESFPIYTIHDELPQNEWVVVTVTYGQMNVVEELKRKGIKKILLLTEIIGVLLEEE